jgi:hypothetical protein
MQSVACGSIRESRQHGSFRRGSRSECSSFKSQQADRGGFKRSLGPKCDVCRRAKASQLSSIINDLFLLIALRLECILMIIH